MPRDSVSKYDHVRPRRYKEGGKAAGGGKKGASWSSRWDSFVVGSMEIAITILIGFLVASLLFYVSTKGIRLLRDFHVNGTDRGPARPYIVALQQPIRSLYFRCRGPARPCIVAHSNSCFVGIFPNMKKNCA